MEFFLCIAILACIWFWVRDANWAKKLKEKEQLLEEASDLIVFQQLQIEEKDKLIRQKRERITELEQAGNAKVLAEYQKRLRDLSVENSQLKQRETDLNGIIERNKYMWKLNEEDVAEMTAQLGVAASLIKEYEQREYRLIKEVYRLRALLNLGTDSPPSW